MMTLLTETLGRNYLSALNMQCDFFVVLVTFWRSGDKDQQESRAVAEKPHGAVVKFDVSRFTAASRGPPCNSTVSCLISLNL